MKISELVYDKSKYPEVFIQKMCQLAKKLNCTELSAFKIQAMLFVAAKGDLKKQARLIKYFILLAESGISGDDIIDQMVKNES